LGCHGGANFRHGCREKRGSEFRELASMGRSHFSEMFMSHILMQTQMWMPIDFWPLLARGRHYLEGDAFCLFSKDLWKGSIEQRESVPLLIEVQKHETFVENYLSNKGVCVGAFRIYFIFVCFLRPM
jgi:hypothetical protein